LKQAAFLAKNKKRKIDIYLAPIISMLIEFDC